MKPFEEIKYKGCTIKLHYDEGYDSPNDWNDSRFLVYDHRQFYLKMDGFEPRDIFEYFEEKPYKRVLYKGHHVFTVYAYIHSGVSLSLGRSGYPFNDRWDVSSTGYMLIKREKGSWKEEEARKIAEGLIETWNQYLSGQVYGYQTEDPSGEDIHSCWGYYDKDQMIEDAKGEINYYIKQQMQEHTKRLKGYIKSSIPFVYRKPCSLSLK